MMEHLHRLVFRIPSTLFDVPDGLYGDVDNFLTWLESPNTQETIRGWEERQRLTLNGVIQALDEQLTDRASGSRSL